MVHKILTCDTTNKMLMDILKMYDIAGELSDIAREYFRSLKFVESL